MCGRRLKASNRILAGVVTLAGLLLPALQLANAAPASGPPRWITYTSDVGALVFSYPAGVFTEQQGDPTEPLQARTPDRVGKIFTSGDGQAVLQIGTFPNLDNTSVDDLRKRAMAASYNDAKIEYNRTSTNWYALSGTRAKETFYERVHFSCNNRRLDIWTMTYPTDDSDFYDAIVEEMAKRFRPIIANVRCP